MFKMTKNKFKKALHDKYFALSCTKSKMFMNFFSPFYFFLKFIIYKMDFVFEKNASFSFYGPSKFFRLALLSKNFEIFKTNKIYTFFVIKDQVIHHKIDDRMLSQKKTISLTFSPKGDFEKKISQIFGILLSRYCSRLIVNNSKQ